MYKDMLERMRKEASTPIDPVMPAAPQRGLISKKVEPETKEIEANDPTSLMKEWFSVIRSNADATRKKFQQEAETSTILPPAKKPVVVPEDEQTKALIERRSLFDGISMEYDEGGDFQLDIKDTKSLVRSKEGFRSSPYWDTNAYRVGYGSDTVTRADGTVERVSPGITVSKMDAERDLNRRIKDFQRGIVADVGVESWSSLPEKAKAALTSVAYNYGSLPRSVVSAVKSYDTDRIANSVADLKSHNAGVNRKRRLHEAALIRSSWE